MNKLGHDDWLEIDKHYKNELLRKKQKLHIA